MKRSIVFIASLTIATIIGCNSMQQVQTIHATPIIEEGSMSLAVGDYAPAISIDHWVKGGAIDSFENGQVYVMEFWATWCGPCLTSIPHLTKIQEEYADNNVNVIGCAIWQREDTQDARETTVSTFVEDQGDNMNYTVAVDNESWMSDNWMKPAGRNGIPSAFIIDGTGTVAWIGSPFSMDEPLKQIVNGTWDLAAASEKFAIERTKQDAGDELRTLYRSASENGEWDTSINAIDRFIAEYGSDTQLSFMKFDALLNGKKDKGAAYQWARTMLATSWDDPNALNMFAWGVLDETPADLQDLDYALEVATRASELTENKNSMILDTLARAYWELGETYKAIAWQQKAVEYADEGDMSESIAATLREYETSLVSVEIK